MLRITYPPLNAFVHDIAVQPKVAPVVALMAVRAKQLPAEYAWLTAQEIGLLPGWRASKSKSVGTEVYNAFAKLKLQAGGIVESPSGGKVKQWRIKDLMEVTWEPDFDTVAHAVALLGLDESLDEHLKWLAPAIQSTCLANGVDPQAAANAGREACESAKFSPPMVRAAVHVVYASALSRLGLGEHNGVDSQDLIEQLLEDHSLWEAVGEKHPFRERIDGQLAYAQRRHESADKHAPLERAYNLARKATSLLQQGDSCSAGALFNTAGCIANAVKAFDEGKRWLMAAIPLLLAHGALMELEAAIFNLTLNTVRRAAQHQPDASKSQARVLIKIDQALSRTFCLGHDFVQTELLAAKLAIEDGDFDTAEAELNKAQQMLVAIKNPWEHACYWRRRAHLSVAKILQSASEDGTLRPSLLQELKEAAHWMRSTDEAKTADVLDAARNKLLRIRLPMSLQQALRNLYERL